MEVERREAREGRAATLVAAAWRGHVCREGTKALERLIATSHEPTEQENDDAQQLREWMEDEAEARGVTVEELVRNQGVEEPPGQEEDYGWEEEEEEDRYEREWEQYKAAHRLERMWG